MRPLTAQEITTFATRRAVHTRSVENFLMTLDEGAGREGNVANADADAVSYGWNGATLIAIRAGIALAFDEKK